MDTLIVQVSTDQWEENQGREEMINTLVKIARSHNYNFIAEEDLIDHKVIVAFTNDPECSKLKIYRRAIGLAGVCPFLDRDLFDLILLHFDMGLPISSLQNYRNK